MTELNSFIYRLDGRRENQLRKVLIELGLSDGANGSAYIEIGGTKLMCSIHGPRSAPTRNSAFSDEGQLECDFRYAPFAISDPFFQKSTTEFSAEERLFSEMIVDALGKTVRLEKYPKLLISIHILVLQNCGGELAAALTCSSAALADAGIELIDITTACQVVKSADYFFVDPTKDEIQMSSSSLCLGCSNKGEISFLNVHGRVEPSDFQDMQRLSFGGCRVLQEVVRDSLRSKYKELIKTCAGM